MNGQPNDHIVATSNMAIDQDDNGFLRRNRFDVSIVSNQAFDEYLASWASGYQDKAGCDLSSIFLPYTTHNPETRTNRFPIFEDLEPEYEAGIGVDRLLPWKYEPTGIGFEIVEGETNEDSIGNLVTGEIWPVKTRDVRHTENIRGLGLRGPIIVTGWGYGTDGNPVPSGITTSGFKSPEGSGEVEFGYQVDPSDYVSAPLKLDYDRRRKTWVSLGWADEPVESAHIISVSSVVSSGSESGIEEDEEPEIVWDRESPPEIEYDPSGIEPSGIISRGVLVPVSVHTQDGGNLGMSMHFDSYGQLSSVRRSALGSKFLGRVEWSARQSGLFYRWNYIVKPVILVSYGSGFEYAEDVEVPVINTVELAHEVDGTVVWGVSLLNDYPVGFYPQPVATGEIHEITGRTIFHEASGIEEYGVSSSIYTMSAYGSHDGICGSGLGPHYYAPSGL